MRAQWPTRDARFVRVTLTAAYASAYWSVGELEVWGTLSTASPGTPLSRSGWSATASGTASGTAPASALDGSLETRWSDGVAQNNTQWFQADMGATRTFSRVQLIAGGVVDNAEGDYPRGYEVYVSNGGAWTLVAAGTGTGNALTITFPTQNARYVNIHETGTDAGHWWSIAELLVLP